MKRAPAINLETIRAAPGAGEKRKENVKQLQRIWRLEDEVGKGSRGGTLAIFGRAASKTPQVAAATWGEMA
jgi:hypothetical protein